MFKNGVAKPCFRRKIVVKLYKQQVFRQTCKKVYVFIKNSSIYAKSTHVRVPGIKRRGALHVGVVSF